MEESLSKSTSLKLIYENPILQVFMVAALAKEVRKLELIFK